jgi:hypothetical protein
LDGYYHGVTISLKTGTDLQRVTEKILSALKLTIELDPLQTIYGRLLSKTSPWAGKCFKRVNPDKLLKLTDGHEKAEIPTYLGINSFRKANKDFVNNLAGHVLSAVIDMQELPRPEGRQHSWIHAKGGLFIARRQMSVGPEHPKKEVIALNYRWKNLANKFPNRLLIDEIVQIADGLYLGKLYYATSLTTITKDFDPTIPIQDYDYRPFGYFLLMDDSWLHEKNTLFPDLTYRIADNLPEKFSELRLIDSPESSEIKEAVAGKKTILHYLQELSIGVEKGTDSEDKYFAEMRRLFLCGQRPDGIEGFFHGGVVAFKSSGFFSKLGPNVLNTLWPKIRPFSPWTGKTFSPTTVKKLQQYIGENATYYEGTSPLLLGTNTYRKDLDLSLPATAFVERLKVLGMPVEYPDENEKDEDIYVKSFFFIATNGPSVREDCHSKEVLQFNYRWPELHTMPPDHLCLDELVRIADGLYLGQLLYSTKLNMPYSPDEEPGAYNYERFGYFMLMDDDWWSIKEFISFDTES